MSDRPPLLVIAAGGTGGHMFPAQSLAEVMLRRGWRVKLSTDPRGARYVGGFPDEVQIEQVASATFARGGLIEKFLAPFQIATGVVAACFKMMRDRPDIVVGFGGYPTIPAMSAAVFLKLPRMIHEQNGVLGRVNQRFASRVDLVACGTNPTALPPDAVGMHIGNPVRRAVLERAGAPYIPPGDYPLSILVIGGSQGARILSDIVPPAIAELPIDILQRVRVSHQARDEDTERVSHFYSELGVKAEVEPFFTDVPERMAEAQLVISRAGASSVADISVIGRPSILVPLAAAIRDEQTANARALFEVGATILVPESKLAVDTLSEQIATVLTNPEGAREMAHRAFSVSTPDAPEHLADLTESLARGWRPDRPVTDRQTDEKIEAQEPQNGAGESR